MRLALSLGYPGGLFWLLQSGEWSAPHVMLKSGRR